jgi:hypothetical protein
MMGAVARQQYLQFGPEHHYELLHGRHNALVSIARRNPLLPWDEKAVAHDTALLRASAFIQDPEQDVYWSQSGLTGRRVTQCVSVIPALWVDLDVYNVPELAQVSRDELLDRIAAAFTWLPTPTMTIASGRGYYLQWCFTEPLSRDYSPRWQAVEDALTRLLRPFGADPACRDATRLLRVVGGTNTKNGASVNGYRTGELLPFVNLERLVLSNALTETPRLVTSSPIPSPSDLEQLSRATPAQKAQYLKGYQLAYDRMQDCERIACLRGSPRLQDYRSRLLYVYAVAGAWYCSERDQLEQALTAFAEQHFEDARRYTVRQVGTVIDRMTQGKQGISQIWRGRQVDRRYRLSNSTIIANLDITPDEQAQLKTIIGPQERQQRRIRRRRASGMVDYEKRTAERLDAVKSGLNAGLSQSEIAAQLGISQPAVSKLAKRIQPNGAGSPGVPHITKWFTY